MTLLKFVRDDGEIGLLNWFAVHPTSVNFHYKLTTSDNKGYAAYVVKQAPDASARTSWSLVAFAIFIVATRHRLDPRYGTRPHRFRKLHHHGDARLMRPRGCLIRPRNSWTTRHRLSKFMTIVG